MTELWQNLFNPTAAVPREPWSWPKRLAACYLGVVLAAFIFGIIFAKRSNGISFFYFAIVTLPWSMVFPAAFDSIDFPVIVSYALFIASGPLNAYLIYKILDALRVKFDR